MIKAENIGKKYIIGHLAERRRYTALRDVLMQNARNLWNKTKDLATGKPIIQGDTMEEVWALRNINFVVARGDAVGIIGRNGAGKSTLLKILSRITEPTTGRVTIQGRVASLLEVGTGFHHELSGRENIYLNGAILGMTRTEIKQKFDEIVAFAEVEHYLDTPVKRYSSGMYVRLAFAVAAHLEPEILVVDEVLAVGDAAFQKKCLGKMGDVATSGRTILFVSHNMGAIRSLCSRAMWLDNGQILATGEAGGIIKQYEKSMTGISDQSPCFSERDASQTKGKGLHFNRVEVMDTEGRQASDFKYGERIVLHVGLGGQLMGGVFSAEFRVYNESGILVSVGASGVYHGEYYNGNVKKLRIDIGPLTMTSGSYRIALSIMSGHERVDTWEDAIAFAITECQPFRMSWEMPSYREGVCVLQHSFQVMD
ncbi:MAG: ATP-binding cassette domain-containing protein [Deltaproteobacteria bacterium]